MKLAQPITGASTNLRLTEPLPAGVIEGMLLDIEGERVGILMIDEDRRHVKVMRGLIRTDARSHDAFMADLELDDFSTFKLMRKAGL